MFSSNSTYCLRIVRGMIVPFIIGLLVFGIGNFQGTQTDGDVRQTQPSYASAVDNPGVSSLATISENQKSGKISPENLFGDVSEFFLWGLVNDTMSEDDRLYPQLFSYCPACRQPADPSYRLGGVFSPFDNIEDLSLIILATVVFLN